MKMLALLPVPNQKLHHNLWEKRIHTFGSEVPLRIKRQAVLLIPLLMEHVLQTLAAEWARRFPARYAAVGVRCCGELERRGGGGRWVQEGEHDGDVGSGLADCGVEDVACDWGFLFCGHGLICGCWCCGRQMLGERFDAVVCWGGGHADWSCAECEIFCY